MFHCERSWKCRLGVSLLVCFGVSRLCEASAARIKAGFLFEEGKGNVSVDPATGVTAKLARVGWVPGGGLEFDGTGGAATVEVEAPSNPQVEIWFTPDLENIPLNKNQGLMRSPNGNGLSSGFRIHFVKRPSQIPGQVLLGFNCQISFGDERPKYAGITVPTERGVSREMHLIFSYNHENISIEIDGKRDETAETRDIHYEGTNPLVVGRSQWPFKGIIRRVRISELSPGETPVRIEKDRTAQAPLFVLPRWMWKALPPVTGDYVVGIQKGSGITRVFDKSGPVISFTLAQSGGAPDTFNQFRTKTADLHTADGVLKASWESPIAGFHQTLSQTGKTVNLEIRFDIDSSLIKKNPLKLLVDFRNDLPKHFPDFEADSPTTGKRIVGRINRDWAVGPMKNLVLKNTRGQAIEITFPGGIGEKFKRDNWSTGGERYLGYIGLKPEALSVSQDRTRGTFRIQMRFREEPEGVNPRANSSLIRPLDATEKSAVFEFTGKKNTHKVVFDKSPYASRSDWHPNSATRMRKCLNGIWQFCPIRDEVDFTPDTVPLDVEIPRNDDWWEILVPGYWKGTSATGGDWIRSQVFPDGRRIPKEWADYCRGWYRTEFEVPAAARGMRTFLEFGAVSVYCRIFVNGREVGEHLGHATPFEIEITDAAEPGQTNELFVYNVDWKATYRRSGNLHFYNSLPFGYSTRSNYAGIWQDVYVECRPKAYIQDILVIPSVRRKNLAVRVEFSNITPGPISLCAEVQELDRSVVLKFASVSLPDDQGNNEITIDKRWRRPRLWSPDDPHLYLLRVYLEQKNGLVDEKYVRFGFREVWVEDENLILNGRIIHIRGDWITAGGSHNPLISTPAYSRMRFEALKKLNFFAPRHVGLGALPAIFHTADELGFPIIATGYHHGLVTEQGEEQVKREIGEWIRRDRNHPCILLWSMQNEHMSHSPESQHFRWQRSVDMTAQSLDPTRPYYHDGHALYPADEDKTKCYDSADLCGTAPVCGIHYPYKWWALSDRLSQFEEWSRRKPLILGETLTFNHGARQLFYVSNTFGNTMFYLDPEQCTDEYGRLFRRIIGWWRSYKVSGVIGFPVSRLTAFCDMPGGMQDVFYEWKNVEGPGSKAVHSYIGGYVNCNPFVDDLPSYRFTSFGDWVRKAYNDVLVTIRDFQRNYYSGERVTKPVVVLNDTAAKQNFALEWYADGIPEARGKSGLRVPQGQTRAESISFRTPMVAEPTEFALVAGITTADGKESIDRQSVVVYPRREADHKLHLPLYLYDGLGTGETVLRSLGYAPIPLQEFTMPSAPNSILVIGPGSLDAKVAAAKSLIRQFAENGGRVFIMEQEYTSEAKSSFAECLAPEHPIFRGLHSSILSFWRGAGGRVADEGYPAAGWHGQRALAFELNHNNPIVLELTLGKGVLIACNLLLSKAAGHDPEPTIVLDNILEYLDDYKGPGLPGSLGVIGENTASHLRGLGFEVLEEVEPAAVLDQAELVVIGEDLPERIWDTIAKKDLFRPYLDRGGTVVVLRQNPQVLKSMKLPVPAKLEKKRVHFLRRPLSAGLADGMPIIPADLRSANRPLKWGGYVYSDPAERWTIDLEVPTSVGTARLAESLVQYSFERHFCLGHVDVGKGKLVLFQMPTDLAVLHLSVLGTVLGNLGIRPTAGKLDPMSVVLRKHVVQTPLATASDLQRFKPVDMRAGNNVNIHEENASNVLLKALPIGDHLFEGVVFRVLGGEQEFIAGAARTALALKGYAKPQFPGEITGIAVDAKAKAIHFLHTGSWAHQGGWGKTYDAYRAVFHYENNQTEEMVFRRGLHLDDYHNADNFGHMPGGRLVWLERYHTPGVMVGAWSSTWNNPHPEWVITSMDLVSFNRICPVIVAVTVAR